MHRTDRSGSHSWVRKNSRASVSHVPESATVGAVSSGTRFAVAQADATTAATRSDSRRVMRVPEAARC